MNATDAKEKVKSFIWTLPGVTGVGIGLVRENQIGVIVSVDRDAESVQQVVQRQFPECCIEQFPIEVKRYGPATLAASGL